MRTQTLPKIIVSLSLLLGATAVADDPVCSIRQRCSRLEESMDLRGFP
jgi:hypothetical protein